MTHRQARREYQSVRRFFVIFFAEFHSRQQVFCFQTAVARPLRYAAPVFHSNLDSPQVYRSVHFLALPLNLY